MEFLIFLNILDLLIEKRLGIGEQIIVKIYNEIKFIFNFHFPIILD